MNIKRVILLLFTMLLAFASGISFTVSAEGESVPEVAFASTKEKAYTGIAFETEVKLSKAAGADIAFVVTDGSNRVQGSIPAGEKTAKIKLPAPEKDGESLNYTLEAGNGCKVGKKGEMTVKAYKAPTFSCTHGTKLYIKSGQKVKIQIKSSDRDFVVQDTRFTLRLGSETGQIVGEAILPVWGEKVSMTIEHTNEWGQIVDLYVCFEDAGTVCGKLQYVMATENDYGIRRVETDQKVMSISFDCAYGAEFTDYILDTLDEYDAKVTFFVTGFWVEAYPEYVKKIVDRGHEIGTHTLNHPRLTQLGDGEVFEEIIGVCDMVEELTGVRPTVFRPPYGANSPRIVGIAKSIGCDTILWACDSYDWKTDVSADYIINRSIKDRAAGDIMLFHNAAPLTKETLRSVLDNYTKDLGLKIIRISDLVYDGNRTVSKEGLVSPGSDYTKYSVKDLLAQYQIDPSVLGVSPEFDVEVKFGEGEWLLLKEEADAILTDSNAFEVKMEQALNQTSQSDLEQNAGRVVFSRPGQPDVTAELIAVRKAVSTGDAGLSGNTDTESDNQGDDRTADADHPFFDVNNRQTLVNTALIAVMAVAAIVFLIAGKKRRQLITG